MRWLKHYRHDNDERWRCCGCCHVQTGTICLGAYNLIGQLFFGFVLLYAILHPELLTDATSRATIDIQIPPPENSGFLPGQNRNVNVADFKVADNQVAPLPTPLAARREFGREFDDDRDRVDRIFYAKNEVIFFTQKRIQSGDAHLALALLFGLFLISAMLIYGAAKGRPIYLLPFFCFQVFDFVLSCLTALGHYTWLPNLKELIENTPDFPFRDQLMQVNAQWIALFVSCMYILLLMVKAYFIGVVWACYQYLHARNTGIFSYTDEGDGIQRDAELLLPPDYENATKLPPVYQGPPPPYHHA